MDKFISICLIPIAVSICFGPALLFWIIAELKGPRDEQNEKK